jgi:murein L,D-transpeptidase YcbB/YkuD
MLGEETVKSLNIPADFRLAQVAANMERHRWLPRSLGERYILVNVPAFQLRAFDSTGVALEMKVIVGEEYEGRTTPAFSDVMEHVVFRPYWNVTPDIQSKEIEPKIASNPGYMAANNYEWWNEGGARRIRQRPGPKNSLGLVKFMFPNSYNIYLHDTPARSLFQREVRAFSHGCIRLERPAELAQWVLGWDANRVEQAMESGPNNRTVKLTQKIPVYIAYFTAYAQDGRLHFGNDLYSHDEDLAALMGPGARPSAEALQRLEALRKLIAE